MKRKRLERIAYGAWIMVGMSVIVGGIVIPSTPLTILLVVVGLAICLGEGIAAFRRKPRARRRKKWSAWVTYLAMLVCATGFFAVAWMVAGTWWAQMIWVATGIALCVPPPEIAKR